ncbi:fanconi-associated nuclease 1-like [Ostrinia furnacalis]|uniref:fanconi-associated nuclease 1-like n=1 Tax=Ostrinia furnacalis TaxID=93504 RepID=UPI00103CD2DD|nr:fanconi-associated nuclease 1-like [Ostrinia furnacalis]
MHVVKPGMRLVCRLYWHKEGWYKKEKLKFILAGNEEIDDPTLHEVLQSLEENGFLTSDGNSLSFEDYTSLLNGDELKQICKELKIKISSKQGAIASLKSYSREKSIVTFFNTNKTNNNTSRVLRIMSSKAGPCYKLSDVARRTIYKLYILMYLGINYNIIREKNLELTLLYDKINRETYPVEDDMLDDASVVFRERAEFESYVKAFDVYEAFLIEDVLDKKVKTATESLEVYKGTSEIEVQRQKSIPEWLRRYTPLNLYIKILEAGIQDLKKNKKYQSALEILQLLISQDSFRQHKKAEWYAEMALVLQKCDQKEEAAEILLEGFRSNLSEEAKDVMRPRAKLVAKHTANQEMKSELLDYASKEQILEKNLRGVHIYKQPMDRTQQKGKLKFETRQSGERTVHDVEEYCLSEYLNKGEFTNGMHWEGRIITTMFFLLFWDIIYWKPPGCVGVFLTRFQKLPLDLFCESFYKNRSESIEARLSLIERSSVEELLWIMQSKWCTRPETEHSGLSRDSMSWEQVCGVVTCLGGGALAALCRRLARDYRHAHSGFPDLTLWNTRTNQIRFVEVKSDTDRPSMKQIQWMHYLQQNGIDTEFCYVGVHTTRCKARSIS